MTSETSVPTPTPARQRRTAKAVASMARRRGIREGSQKKKNWPSVEDH